MKSLPLANVINNQLGGYYSSLSDSEAVLNDIEGGWLDLASFVSYILDGFERCLIDAALSKNALSEVEREFLSRMKKLYPSAQITTQKAAGVLQRPENVTRTVLNGLV